MVKIPFSNELQEAFIRYHQLIALVYRTPVIQYMSTRQFKIWLEKFNVVGWEECELRRNCKKSN